MQHRTWTIWYCFIICLSFTGLTRPRYLRNNQTLWVNILSVSRQLNWIKKSSGFALQVFFFCRSGRFLHANCSVLPGYRCILRVCANVSCRSAVLSIYTDLICSWPRQAPVSGQHRVLHAWWSQRSVHLLSIYPTRWLVTCALVTHLQLSIGSIVIYVPRTAFDFVCDLVDELHIIFGIFA